MKSFYFAPGVIDTAPKRSWLRRCAGYLYRIAVVLGWCWAFYALFWGWPWA